MDDIRQICYDNVKHMYTRFDLPCSDRVFVDWAEMTASSVTIKNSFCIGTRRDMLRWVLLIKEYELCPDNIRHRSNTSPLRQWEAHNLLYMLGKDVEHTMHVRFGNEPLASHLRHAILSLVYHLRIF